MKIVWILVCVFYKSSIKKEKMMDVQHIKHHILVGAYNIHYTCFCVVLFCALRVWCGILRNLCI